MRGRSLGALGVLGLLGLLGEAGCEQPQGPDPGQSFADAGLPHPQPWSPNPAPASDGGIVIRDAPVVITDAPIAFGDAPGASCSPDAFGGPSSMIRPLVPDLPERAAKAVPPITGGTLLALSDGKTAVAADPDRDLVYVVDLDGNKVRATLALQVGDEPGRVIEDAAKRVHVALRRGGAVVTIDPAAGTLGARRPVCSAPRGLAYQAAGDLVHVACAGGELVSLPAAGGAATRTLTLERDLRDVVVGVGGKLLVSTFRRAEVLVVGADGQVGERLRPGSGMATPIFGQPRLVTPAVAWRMVPMNNASGAVMVLHETGVADEINPGFGGYGGFGSCSAIVQTGVSMLAPGGPPAALAKGFDQMSLAVDVAVSPDGKQLAIAVPGNGTVNVPLPTIVSGQLDPQGMVVPIANSANAGPPGADAGAGFAPDAGFGCSPGPTGVPGAPRGEVVAVSYASNGVLLAQVRDPAQLWRSDMPATPISLSSESRADTGHLLFHANAGAGLACASCHPEGGEDGRVWKFACQGSRRTQSIRGTISGTAPFHWDGAEKDFSALMDDVFVQRMSGPKLLPAQKDALSGWIDTIPALPLVTGLDAAAVERGKAVFNDPKVACATCHLGPMLTSNATVDVGTGRPLQVPSLRGLSWRAPFMHDGCAATLADRFGMCGGGDKHGVTSQLAPAEIADLTAYLQSL